MVRTRSATTHPIRAVLFDLGGTLLDTEDYAGWVDTAERFGWQLRADDLVHWYGETERVHDETGAFPRIERFWQEVLTRSLGRSVPADSALAFVDAVQRRRSAIHLFSDARGCLDAVERSGRQLGIVSNSQSEEQVRELLVRTGISPYFRVVVSSGTEGIEKPDREIFLRALARVSVAPDQAFYVGNLPNTDVRGAQAAGLRAVWLNRRGTGVGGALPEITSLRELAPYLDRLEREILRDDGSSGSG